MHPLATKMKQTALTIIALAMLLASITNALPTKSAGKTMLKKIDSHAICWGLADGYYLSQSGSLLGRPQRNFHQKTHSTVRPSVRQETAGSSDGRTDHAP